MQDSVERAVSSSRRIYLEYIDYVRNNRFLTQSEQELSIKRLYDEMLEQEEYILRRYPQGTVNIWADERVKKNKKPIKDLMNALEGLL